MAHLEHYKAGSPTDSRIYWVTASPKIIAASFNTQYPEFVNKGKGVSHRQIKLLLNELGFGYRKQDKQLATGHFAQRNAQFDIIFNLTLIMSLTSPVISIDCKKKERLGNLYRAGKCYSTESLKVYDHDYDNLSEGKVIPHGIYDLQANIGYISIGNSSETAQFIADNLEWWWTEFGRHLYPEGKNILLFCDAGGGNSYRHHIFKEVMIQLAKKLGVSFIICHYPPYASKWNPIEHRLFCHVHQAIQGIVFDSYETITKAIQNTNTQTGLKVVVRCNLKKYEKEKNGDPKIKEHPNIKFHKQIPNLNYRIMP